MSSSEQISSRATSTVDSVYATAMSLPPEARAILAERILESVEAIDPDIESAWSAEIERRIQGYRDGSIAAVDAEVVFRGIASRKNG